LFHFYFFNAIIRPNKAVKEVVIVANSAMDNLLFSPTDFSGTIILLPSFTLG